MRKTMVIFFVTLIGLSCSPYFVFSENENSSNKEELETLNKQIAEKKEKIKQLEKNIADYKIKITQKQLESASLNNQMAILENRISHVQLDIQATQEKIDTVTLEIEGLALSILEKEKVIKRQKDILKNLLQTIHYEDSKKYIEILVAYDNFSDFYNRIQYLETIEGDIGKSVQAIRILKEELSAKKQQAEEIRHSYEELNSTLQNRRKDLDEQIVLKNDLLSQTKASELTYKTLLANLRSQYQKVENEIVSIEQEVRKRLEKENKITGGNSTANLSWPTANRYITAYFHDPEYPFRRVFEHSGIDIRAGQGTVIRAAGSGYVARARKCSNASCYSYVMIIHSGGISTVYGHLSGIVVLEDQFVATGDTIGYSGGTPGTVGAGPFVTGPHLHFEVRKNGIPTNPLNYL